MKKITLLLCSFVLTMPVFAAMNHGGMVMDDKGMIMNNNPDNLPKDCQAISEDVNITIRGGHKFAKHFARKIFGKLMTTATCKYLPAPVLMSLLSMKMIFAINL